mgnify:CR=1 FL=1
MKLLKKIAIIFFDIIDCYYHQKKIIKFIRKNSINPKYILDVGSHMGTYTDLILKDFKNCKVLMFEPQINIFKKIKKNIKVKKTSKFTVVQFLINPP